MNATTLAGSLRQSRKATSQNQAVAVQSPPKIYQNFDFQDNDSNNDYRQAIIPPAFITLPQRSKPFES